MPGQILAFGYDMAASCADRTGKADLAYRYTLDGTALNEGSDWIWRYRLVLEFEKDRFEPALTTIESMAKTRPAAFNGVPIQLLAELSRKLKNGHQDALRRRLLNEVLEKGYRPEEMFSTLDHFRQDYAGILYEAGDKVGAAAQIHRIEDPEVANEVSFDIRFRPMLGADFDARASVERDLAKARALMAQHPDLLEPILQVTRRLRQLGKPVESLAVLEAARPRIAGTGAFTDAATQTNWWWDGLSSSYTMLGKYDEAVASMRAGADAQEREGLNVSQMINLSELQNQFGKPEEALITLAPFAAAKRPVSPYGEMALRGNRTCANMRAGNKDAVAADLAYVQAHDADNRYALTYVQLCLGDLDGAAASIIRQLADPDRRTAALVDLSDYDDPPVELPVDPVEAARKKVKARADVQAAIAQAGGTRRIHLQAGMF